MNAVKTHSGEASGPSSDEVTLLGWLHFLASFCPLHQRYAAADLAKIFIPAINAGSVRTFANEDGAICAALIWARLSDQVSERMLFERKPPEPHEWDCGPNLWFLTLLAPFDHGKIVARTLARDPPEEPFYFARIGAGGTLRKVVRGDATGRGRQVQAFRMTEAGAFL